MAFNHDSPALLARRLVEVRSPREILATLDQHGQLDGLPFMPEMLAFCGQRITVARRANRTCVVGHGFRRMRSAVFLQDARCNGSVHDHCDRGCLLFWKEAWLKPLDADSPGDETDHAADLKAARVLARLPTRRAGAYVCQSTQLAAATTPIGRWDLRPWLGEVWRGELSLRAFVGTVWGALRRRVLRRPDAGVLAGSAQRPSRGELRLAPGEWITVKSTDEICGTLDVRGRNRGLTFQPTMNDAIGRTFRVAFPVRRMIVETTGKMIELGNTVALEGVTCQGACVAHCPRQEYLFWRESWLRRVQSDALDS